MAIADAFRHLEGACWANAAPRHVSCTSGALAVYCTEPILHSLVCCSKSPSGGHSDPAPGARAGGGEGRPNRPTQPADHAASARQGLESMAVYTWAFERADHPLNPAVLNTGVLLGAVWGDARLLQAPALDQRRTAAVWRQRMIEVA